MKPMPRYELMQKRKQERQVWRELPEGSRVVIYGRHSPGESQSIHSQADAMRRFVESRGWVLIREFYDEGIEGSRSDREAFQDLLAFLQQQPRPVDGVITWNTSRFGRDQLDSQFYKADLRRRGYVVLGKEDGIEQSPLAPVLESMLEWKAQQDLAVIGADTKRGLEYLARNGYWPGGALPKGYRGEKELLGYRKNGDPRYGIRIVQDEALRERVVRAWQLRLAGVSYRDIHDAVQLYRNSKGYSTFFDNALYAGILDYGGQRYPEGWQEGKRFCEPYVSLDQFEMLQQRSREFADRQGLGPDRTPGNRGSMYLLSGFVVCGLCLEQGADATLIGWTDRRYPDYQCYRCGRKQRLRGGVCHLPSVSCRLLEDTVVERIRSELFTPEYIRAEVARANELLARHGGDHERTLRQAEAAEKTARRSLEHLGQFIAAHGGNAVIEDQYRAADREWRMAVAALSAARADQRLARPLRVTEAEAVSYAARLADHLRQGTIPARRQFLSSFVRRIVFYGDEGDIELTERPALDAAAASQAGGEKQAGDSHLFGRYPRRDSNP